MTEIGKGSLDGVSHSSIAFIHNTQKYNSPYCSLLGLKLGKFSDILQHRYYGLIAV